MPRDHVSDLFSAAYDGGLSSEQAERFSAHIERCAACATDYDAFRQSLLALRATPRARMPRPVHIPSTPPVAEQRPGAAWWQRIRMRRLVPGGATAIAAVAAAVILVLVTRQASGLQPSNRPLSAGALATPTAGACPSALSSAAVAGPPAGYQHRASAADPGRPGQELVLATQSGSAAPGAAVVVYAQLSVPRPSAAAPGATASGLEVGAVPCVSVTGLSSSGTPAALAAPGVFGGAAPNGSNPVGRAQAAQALLTFTVPPGTAPGTQLHVVATVPPGYPDAGEPPLTADLIITVQ